MFDNIPASDSWVFFSFSADYQNGLVQMYFKIYDGLTKGMDYSDKVSSPTLTLNQNSQFVLGDIQQDNAIFQQIAGFKGQIGQVEMTKTFI